MQISKENVSKISAEFHIINKLSNDVKTLKYAHKWFRSIAMWYVIQGQDLKVIKCTGRAKLVNKVLFSDQCIHRLLFGFVWSGSLYNLNVNI